MEKEFVPYEQALALKELGFDYYQPMLSISSFNENGESIKRPLYQQAFDWFRTEHKLKFYIREDKWNHWCTPKILIPETEDYEEICDSYPTYIEAQIACLRKLIEIVKENL